LVSGGVDKKVYIYDVLDEDFVLRSSGWGGEEGVLCYAYSDKAKAVAMGCKDKSIKIMNLENVESNSRCLLKWRTPEPRQ